MSKKRDLKSEMTWKNNLFSRYMLFRYSLALLFFANIYWMMIAMYKTSAYIILPAIMLVLVVIACAEQFKLYGKRGSILLKWTKLAFRAQCIVNVLAILISLLPNQMLMAFPVFANDLLGKGVVITFQLMAILLNWVNLIRADHVEHNSDKFYYRFQQSFKNIN